MAEQPNVEKGTLNIVCRSFRNYENVKPTIEQENKVKAFKFAYQTMCFSQTISIKLV